MACFFMGTGVLLPLGIVFFIIYFWEDAKGFMKPTAEPIKKIKLKKGKFANAHELV